MKSQILYNLHQQYVRGTKKNSIVLNERVFLCYLTQAVMRGCNLSGQNVYINTRVVKHMYDKKPSEEFDFIIDNLHRIIKHPINIYRNRDTKRGDLCFVKEIDGSKYLCSIEIQKNGEFEVSTAFRVRKENYLNNYKLLWSWRDDDPSS